MEQICKGDEEVFRPSEIAVGHRSQLTTDVMALRRDEHEAPTRGIKESMGGLGKRGDAEQSDDYICEGMLNRAACSAGPSHSNKRE